MYWEETRGVGNGPAEVLLPMFQAKEALRKHTGKAGRRKWLECGQGICGRAKAEKFISICAYSGGEGNFSFLFLWNEAFLRRLRLSSNTRHTHSDSGCA